MIRLAALLLLAVAAPLAAADLTVAKTSQVVSDVLGLALPRVMPGSAVDYSLTVTNPLANLTTPVRGVRISDAIPANVKLRVADLVAANRGPVEFTDGNLLNLGLLGSGLIFRFGGLGDTTDSVEFSDGLSWAYTPVPDADGCDAKVKAVRVVLPGTQSAGSAFRLRFRVVVR
jgi:hypothetical protein